MTNEHGLTTQQIKTIIAFNYAEFLRGIDDFDHPESNIYNNNPNSEQRIAYAFGRTIGQNWVDWSSEEE